jgi:hypothetical protein
MTAISQTGPCTHPQKSVLPEEFERPIPSSAGRYTSRSIPALRVNARKKPRNPRRFDREFQRGKSEVDLVVLDTRVPQVCANDSPRSGCIKAQSRDRDLFGKAALATGYDGATPSECRERIRRLPAFKLLMPARKSSNGVLSPRVFRFQSLSRRRTCVSRGRLTPRCWSSAARLSNLPESSSAW